MTDINDLNNILYFGAAFAIVLIILAIAKSYVTTHRRIPDVSIRYRTHYNKSTSEIASDLEEIKSMLLVSAPGANVNMTDDIDDAISSLNKFIQENPRLNSQALCALEMHTDIINTELIDSVTPDVSSYSKSYNSILDFDEEERDMHMDPRAHLNYLIKNINIAIKLLRKNVCNNGYLDLSKLRNILYKLNAQVSHKGSMHYGNKYIGYNTDPYTRYDKPPSVPLFASIMSTVEPFESRPSRITPLQSTDRLEFSADYTAPHPSYVAADGSFEGTVERDIGTGNPQGQIISLTPDPSHYYTVRSGACGGLTPSDDQFMSQCVGPDIQLEQALNGNASSMLDCIGDCTSEPNYFRWYKQLDMTSAGTDAHGIEDYN